MAQRIFHQISSNVSKSPLLKSPSSLRSSSPQNKGAVTRNLDFTARTSVLAHPNYSQKLSYSMMPIILQTNNNPNSSKIVKRLKHVVDDDQNKDIEEEPQEKFVADKIQEQATEADDMYLTRFQEFLDDSNYPNQTAKEFPFNKHIQPVSPRSPELRLNKEIVHLIKTRSGNRRSHRRLDFEEVEYQADVEYQTAVRNMHIVGQTINTGQYKIDINPTPKSVENKINMKGPEMEFYHHVNRSLQPSKITPFGHTISCKEFEQFKESKIFTTPVIEPVHIQEKVEAVEPVETKSSRSPKKQIADYKEYNSLGQRKESDKFIEQMKMLQPNYKPQKRYNSPNRNVESARSLTNKISSNTKICESHAELKSCKNIINQLKNLNPDYVSSSIKKNKLSETSLVQSTTNLINDYRAAVLNSRIDILNDTLYDTIKALYPERHFQKYVPKKKVSTTTRIKVTIGSKLDLQQHSAATSPKGACRYVKSNTNEKIFVPWANFADTRKGSKTANTSVLNMPKERKISKHTISNRPMEVFLPITRSFCTKARIEKNISREQVVKSKTSTVKNSISAQNMPPKFEFRNSEPWIPMRQRNGNAVNESKSTSKAKIIENEIGQRIQSNRKVLEQKLAPVKATKSQLGTNALIKLNKPRDSTMKVDHGFTLEKIDTNLPKKKQPELPKVNQNFEKTKHQEENCVHKFGDNLSNTKIKFASHIPVWVKLDKAQKSQQEPRKSTDSITKRVVSKTSRNINSADSVKLKQSRYSANDITKVKMDNVPFSSLSNSIKKQIHDKIGTIKENSSKKTKTNKISQHSDIPSVRKNFATSKSNNVLSPPIPIIRSLKLPKKASATTNSNTSSDIQQKKTGSKTSIIQAHDTDSKINACALKSAKKNIDNKLIPLKCASKASDSLFSSEEKNVKMKLRKSPQLLLKKTSLLDIPLCKLKADTMVDMSNIKTEDLSQIVQRDREKIANIVSTEYNSERPECASSPPFSCRSGESLSLAIESQSCPLSTNHKGQGWVNINNTVKRNFSMDSMRFLSKDLTVLKLNLPPFARTYSTARYLPPMAYAKNVRLKRLKKRPGFDEDFPPSNNWKELKHCKTLCDQMQNPKMDELMKYKEKKKKKLPVMKPSNCPRFVLTEQSFAYLKQLKGPSLRPGYVHDDHRKCKITLCEENKATRADNAAQYVVRKKKLPNLRSMEPKVSNISAIIRKYQPTLDYTKKIPIKRLEKRPGFDEDFPPSNNWKELKHCKTLCDQMQNPKMDVLLRYDEKSSKKKLPIMKPSNCPHIDTAKQSLLCLKQLKGPSQRPGYVYDDYRKCKITLCEENKPSRADSIARYVVKKKKLPALRSMEHKVSNIPAIIRKYQPTLDYTKNILIKRLVKRPGFDEDFPPSNNWKDLKHCKTLCDQMQNPKMDELMKYKEKKKKKLPVMKPSNCPRVVITEQSFAYLKQLKGPSLRPGYVHDDHRKCKITLCEENKATRADNAAQYVVRKKKLPNLRSMEPKVSSISAIIRKYQPTLDYTKKISIKRLEKRPGFDEDFPPSNNWKELKHCKTLCDQMQNPKMDKLLRYDEKNSKKKLPIMKPSNCPRIDTTNQSYPYLKQLKGPSVRPGYVYDDYRKCKITLCEENKPSRADNIARYVVKKKKLPALLPLPTKHILSNISDRLKNCPSVKIECNKSIHTSASLLKHEQTRSREGINKMNRHNTKHNEPQDESSKAKDSTESINIAKVGRNPRCDSPYLSYSEYIPQWEPPLFDFETTPDYLQPNCPLVGPTFALEPPPPVTTEFMREENFTRIPNPRIQELNKFAEASAFASQQKIDPKEEDESKARPQRGRTSESSIRNLTPKSTLQNVKHIVQEHKIYNSRQKEATETKELFHSSVKEEIEPDDQTSQSSGIEIKRKDSETDLFSGTCKNQKYFIKEILSLWNRISNYFRAKLDGAVDVQNQKPKPDVKQDLFLCSEEECKNSSPELCQNDLLKQFVDQSFRCEHCPNDYRKRNCNYVEERPQMKDWQSIECSFQKFSKEYDTFIHELKEGEDKCALSSLDKHGSGTKLLKSSIERSKDILTRKKLSTFSVHSRAYSSRSPKTPFDLLEYFSRIQNEKTSNIDEDELANNILTAIKVGMELIKKSKSTNITDTYLDLFNQLDAVSKSELQTLKPNEGDIHALCLWPPGCRKTNLQDQENMHVVNTIQRFCQNVCDIQSNYNSVFDYEQSERKKTEDLQRVLDDMLKRNAET